MLLNSLKFQKVLKRCKSFCRCAKTVKWGKTTTISRNDGLIFFFLPDNSTVIYPVRQLLPKNFRFQRTAPWEAAFIKQKTEIFSERIVRPCDLNLPVILKWDTSPVGVVGVLLDIICDQEQPIAFESRTLTTAERNYSLFDWEALAIVFSVNHFLNYPFGSYFPIATNNWPLKEFSH